ncbi:hypothetical protein BJ979_003206 [Schumannella luteola]|uniref:Uncharacterized protein n=1 Tax=Schumannella luteola TaxID=472059 RepID=A0A852YH15_9MICO|nr:hypothetical protein [Schumannella luteola]
MLELTADDLRDLDAVVHQVRAILARREAAAVR